MSPRSFQKWKSLTKSGLGGISTFDWALYTKRGPVRNNWSKPSVHACRIWHSTKFGPGLFKVNSVEVPRIKRYRQVGWLEQFVRWKWYIMMTMKSMKTGYLGARLTNSWFGVGEGEGGLRLPFTLSKIVTPSCKMIFLILTVVTGIIIVVKKIKGS